MYPTYPFFDRLMNLNLVIVGRYVPLYCRRRNDVFVNQAS